MYLAVLKWSYFVRINYIARVREHSSSLHAQGLSLGAGGGVLPQTDITSLYKKGGETHQALYNKEAGFVKRGQQLYFYTKSPVSTPEQNAFKPLKKQEPQVKVQRFRAQCLGLDFLCHLRTLGPRPSLPPPPKHV